MRILPRVVLPVVLLSSAAIFAVGDEPAPLLKPAVPGAGGVRARIPIHTENKYTDSQIRARVPGGKGKKGEMFDATIALDTLPGNGAVSTTKWKSWGYAVPKNKIGILPEIVLPAALVGTRTKGASDIEVKFRSIAVDIVDPPGDSDLIYGSDLYLRLTNLTKKADRTFEPRLYFADRFLELTVPRGSVKALGTGDGGAAETAVTRDSTRVPVATTMAIRNVPVFAFASINGVTKYRKQDGKLQDVDVGVSSNTNWPGGIMMSLGAAHGCGIEFEDGVEGKGIGAAFKTTIARGKAKEFRLALQTGPDFSLKKDLVLKDVTVYVDKADSGHFVWLGTKFIAENIADGVYTCGTDNAWRLLGRVKPELLMDVKTRK